MDKYSIFLNMKINEFSIRYDLTKDKADKDNRDFYINLLEKHIGKIRSTPVQLELKFEE